MISREPHLQATLPNGLTLIVEPMDWLESAAVTLLIPRGAAHDPPHRGGLHNLTCEMVQRGCGARNSRQFVQDLENLGVDLSGNVANGYTTYSGAMLAENLTPALEILADLVQRPHLPAAQLADARQVCLQEVISLEDDLAQKTMQTLRRRRYSDPWGRAAIGDVPGLEACGMDDVQAVFDDSYGAPGSILAIAGRVDWEALKQTVARLFGDWTQIAERIINEQAAELGYEHLPSESNQTHIALAYPAPAYDEEDYFQARGAVGVLSDGVSSRLFTEVREKRGLCYTVSAYCHVSQNQGSILCYAGTTPERSQQTLDVVREQFRDLHQGIAADELQRLQARLKSNLIMQQESSSARANALAGDMYLLGRTRTVEQLRALVDGLTLDSIQDFLQRRPLRELALVTLGPNALEFSL